MSLGLNLPRGFEDIRILLPQLLAKKFHVGKHLLVIIELTFENLELGAQDGRDLDDLLSLGRREYGEHVLSFVVELLLVGQVVYQHHFLELLLQVFLPQSELFAVSTQQKNSQRVRLANAILLQEIVYEFLVEPLFAQDALLVE